MGRAPLCYRALIVCWIVGKLGSNWNNGGNCSPFYLNVNNTSGNRNRNISGQLLYVPVL